MIEKRQPKNGRRVSDKFYQIVSDNLPVSVITIDTDGYITSANKYFRNFSNLKDYHHHSIFNDQFFIRENLVSDFKKILKDGVTIKREGCHEVNSKGEDKYLRITAVPFRNNKGEIEGAISLASDYTEAYMAKTKLIELNNSLEQKVKDRTEELDRLNGELKKVLELKSVFMADVSHEFRTSLTIIQCSLELISKSADIKGENMDLYNNVTLEIKRLSTMLTDLAILTKSDLLDSRFANGKIIHKKIDLNQIIISVCKELRVLAYKEGIDLKYIESQVPIDMTVDDSDIDKLLMNLIRNAVKYNKKNGWIKVSTKTNKHGVYITVQDNGIGIPEKEIPLIFERFYRVDKARTRKEGGSGLGLAICKHIVEMHEGNIRVSSKFGKGTKFIVYLPYEHSK